MKTEYTITHISCSHRGKREEQNFLFQGDHDPAACICQNCIIDYNQILEEKETKLEKDFLNILSQFKDQERALRLNQKLLKLEKLSPKLFEKVCDYIDQIHQDVKGTIAPEPPDIIA